MGPRELERLGQLVGGKPPGVLENAGGLELDVVIYRLLQVIGQTQIISKYLNITGAHRIGSQHA